MITTILIIINDDYDDDRSNDQYFQNQPSYWTKEGKELRVRDLSEVDLNHFLND